MVNGSQARIRLIICYHLELWMLSPPDCRRATGLRSKEADFQIRARFFSFFLQASGRSRKILILGLIKKLAILIIGFGASSVCLQLDSENGSEGCESLAYNHWRVYTVYIVYTQ